MLSGAAAAGASAERPEAAVAALSGLCRAHALPGAARRIDAWLARRRR
jgi:hypothetical protein